MCSRVDQARRKGRSVVAEALLGPDPQARRQELRLTPTLAQLVSERYLPHAKATKRSWRSDETILRIHILPVLVTSRSTRSVANASPS